MPVRRTLPACLLALLPLAVSAADPVPLPSKPPAADAKLLATADALFDTLKTATLENGLRVYLLPVPGAPTVTTMVAYKVGSGDEEKDQTGLSHYLEHLLFKGTDTLMPGDIDRATQRNGGHNNAYTTEDMTVYHFDFAADRWTKALDIEADRMRNCRIDAKHEFQQEKGAVISELKGNEDRPWELEYKAILPVLFDRADPYSHPVIGEEKHVRGATAEVIKRHYDLWYHPNNAALVVVGGFDPDEAMKLVTDKFAKIPKADLPERKPTVKPAARAGLVRKEFASKFDAARMTVGFNTVRVGDPDDYVLDVVDHLLATGKTARLYKRLVEGDEIANAVTASNSTGRYPGWFGVQVEVLQGKDRRKAEAAAFDELAKLAAKPVPADELARVRRLMLASMLFGREGVHDVCDLIARAVTYKDVEYAKTYLAKVSAVTPEDIQKAAQAYLDKTKAVVVWSVPDNDPNPPVGAKKGGDKATGTKDDARPGEGKAGETLPIARRGEPVPVDPKPAAKADPKKAGEPLDLTKAKRVVLRNGMVCILLENHRLPIVVVEANVADVRLREPADKNGVAALTGELLEEGTAKHTGEQIATIIETTGGSLTLGSSGGSVKVLTPDTDTGLGLLFECLTGPTFPAEGVERKRAQLLSVIADVETQPQNRARQQLNASVYGDHPFGRPAYGRKAVVEKLTAADLKAFHAAAFAPNHTVVVAVGDFDTAGMTKKLETLTADWKPTAGGKPQVAAPPAKGSPGEQIVTDPTAAQTHVFVGHLGVTRGDPDYYALLVMDNVLGVGPGFTDRLSSTLRDRQGLAYTVNASIANSAGDQPGLFVGYIGTFADKYLWVREGFVKEVARIRDEAATDAEVEDAKKYLLGSLPFKLQTNEDVAAQLLAAEKYKLGFDFLTDYRKKVAAVTPADVQAAAKKHLDPKKLTVVTVGPVDSTGKPLAAPKDK